MIRGQIIVEGPGCQSLIFHRQEQIGTRPVNEIDKPATISNQGGIKITAGRVELAQLVSKRAVLPDGCVEFQVRLGLEFELRPASHAVESSYRGSGIAEETRP